MEEDNGDIGSEHLVIDLSPQQEAINLLYTDPEINRKLASIASKSRQNKDDLRQELALKLSTEGYELRDFNSLTAWCCVSAKHICQNAGRHDNVVKRHHKRCVGEGVHLKRGGGAGVVVLRSEVKTPEEQMLEREQEALDDAREAELLARLREQLADVISSLPSDVREIGRLWVEGKSTPEIAAIVEKSLATVYRKLKEFQMEIVEKCGIVANITDEALKSKSKKPRGKKLFAALLPLISDCLSSSANTP